MSKTLNVPIPMVKLKIMELQLEEAKAAPVLENKSDIQWLTRHIADIKTSMKEQPIEESTNKPTNNTNVRNRNNLTNTEHAKEVADPTVYNSAVCL